MKTRSMGDGVLCNSCANCVPDRLVFVTGQTPQEWECVWLVPGAGIKTQCGHYSYEPGALE